MSYDTIGGRPTHGITYLKLINSLREAQEACAVLSHLCSTESGIKDIALAKGWMLIAEMLRKMQLKVTEMAQGRLN